MKGNQLGMGEETALFRRIWEAEESPVFLYSPALKVYHWVPPEKMTMVEARNVKPGTLVPRMK